MRRLAPLALLLAPLLAGCGDLLAVQGGVVAHPGSAHSAYVESFNDVLDAQIDEPLSTPLLTGYDVAVTAYGFFGVGYTRMDGSSEAVFTNGTTQTLDLGASNVYIRSTFPVYSIGATESGMAGGFSAPVALMIDVDAVMRTSETRITQTPQGSPPSAVAFESTDVVLRPALTGVVRGSAFMPGAAANNLSLRASLGYDLPIAADGYDATFSGFLAREYTAANGSITFTGEEQKPGFAGLHGRVSVAFGF